MKKICFIILLILILPAISAVEFTMNSEFAQGETLMAKVSGNFIESILKENVFLYRGHIRVPLELEVAEINDDFYIYAQLLGKNPNNYSIRIENVKYMRLGQVIEEDLTKNFSITEEIADFSIEPGFVITDEDFFIEVQNLQEQDITIDIIENKTSEEEGILGFLFEEEAERAIDLRSEEIKEISFSIKNITKSALTMIELSTANLKYEIPVYIFLEAEEEKEKSFRFEPFILNISISTDYNKTRIIYLYNDGEVDLENITLSISDSLKPYFSISEEEINELDENESIKLTLTLFSDEEKSLEGQIIAEADSLYAYSAVFLNFIEDYQPLLGEEESPPQDPAVLQTCSEMNGTICVSMEVCDGETEYARDGNCCLGECLEIEDDDGWKLTGWLIVIAVIILLYWFYRRRYRKARRKVNLLKIARGKKK